jgi:hypothetical protein
MSAGEAAIHKAKVEKYLEKARPRFEGLEAHQPESIDLKKACREFLEMSQTYYSDAKHFFEKGDYANALAALEYAEGWLDAGTALGILRKKN